MFKSITYRSYDYKTDQHIYELEDSEFGKIMSAVKSEADQRGFEIGIDVIIAKEYSKRNLDVGKNIALNVIWSQFPHGHEALCELQDERCPEHIPNWKDYAKSRDEWLQKLLLLV